MHIDDVGKGNCDSRNGLGQRGMFLPDVVEYEFPPMTVIGWGQLRNDPCEPGRWD